MQYTSTILYCPAFATHMQISKFVRIRYLYSHRFTDFPVYMRLSHTDLYIRIDL